jgi:hypothetical protein
MFKLVVGTELVFKAIAILNQILVLQSNWILALKIVIVLVSIIHFAINSTEFVPEQELLLALLEMTVVLGNAIIASVPLTIMHARL